MDDGQRARLTRWLANATMAASLTIGASKRLSGGAIQQNWALDVSVLGGAFAGAQHWVLRTDNPSAVSVSHSRMEEFALLRAASIAGVTVPEALFECRDATVIGHPFFVMRRVDGITQGFRVVRSDTLGGGREALATSLGQELARIHSIRPPSSSALSFLTPPSAAGPANDLIAFYRSRLDAGRMPRPILEWGLRWLELNAPPTGDIVLCHRDFRTGNFLVTEEKVTGILDWEFAGWGDPLEDIGWFCAPCWRFGNVNMEAGGTGSRDAFYRGYEAESGRVIDRARVAYWEVMATVRWAIIAIDQAERHISGAEANLELALTGHIVPELEMNVLAMTVAA